MIYLVDTNILLRFMDRNYSLHRIVYMAIRKLQADGHRLQTTYQNFAEFWNVATRPVNKNGLGIMPVEAEQLLNLLERLFPLLPDLPDAYHQWKRLVVTFGVSGVQVHDARLVAAMISHGITHILTFNTIDFLRYKAEGIFAVNPASIQPNF